MKTILSKVLHSQNLDRAEAARALEIIMRGEALPEQIGALLAAFRFKGVTVDEVVGFATTMRSNAVKVSIKRKDLIDICGTGGDGAGTFNISTTVAFVAAAGGLGVAKHGNRSVSSTSGSNDVLEALGVNVNADPGDVARSLDEHGLGFFSAPNFHPAMKRMAEIRRALGVRTVFNLLGPLTNPANVPFQLMGIFDAKLLELVAAALGEMGTREAMIVHGEDGLDEITLTGKTFVAHLKNGAVKTYTVSPEDAGLKRAPASELKGEGPEGNAKIMLALLSGSKGPKRDIVLLNAAAAFLVAGKAGNLREGVALAAECIDSGKALGLLEKMRGRAS